MPTAVLSCRKYLCDVHYEIHTLLLHFLPYCHPLRAVIYSSLEQKHVEARDTGR